MEPMIFVTLKEMMAKRDTNMHRLSMDTRIAYTTLFKMDGKRGPEEGIKFGVLSRLCTALKCTPNDLLRYVEDGDDDAMVKTLMATQRKAKPGRPKKSAKK